tara:strand:- start:700 stop:840 length:141 start_codon:yes stop_codon:yes gene_type:complete
MKYGKVKVKLKKKNKKKKKLKVKGNGDKDYGQIPTNDGTENPIGGN